MQAVQDAVGQVHASALARRVVQAHTNLHHPDVSCGYGDGGHASATKKLLSVDHLTDAFICFAIAFCSIFAFHQIIAKRFKKTVSAHRTQDSLPCNSRRSLPNSTVLCDTRVRECCHNGTDLERCVRNASKSKQNDLRLVADSTRVAALSRLGVRRAYLPPDFLPDKPHGLDPPCTGLPPEVS